MFGKIKLNLRSLSTLELDPRNPRLISYRKRGKLNNEKDIISVMVDKYDIHNLINSILTTGFQPDEVLISIPSENNSTKKTIVEGNRRLTACKIIKKPKLLEGTKLATIIPRIQRHKNYASAVETINRLNIVELDDRAAARSYIASKHTKESIKRWSVYTQGAYYIDLLNECREISNLCRLINNSVSTSRIKTIVLFTRIADQITELPTMLDSEKEKISSNLDNIKVEAILRLIQRSDFKKRIGRITLDQYGELVIRKMSTDAYQLILAKIARDTNFSKSLTTRQENEASMKQYILELETLIAEFEDIEDDDIINEEDDINLDFFEEENEEEDANNDEIPNGDNNEPQENLNGNIKPEPQKPRRKNLRLLDKNTIYTVSHKKLDDLIEECKRLNILTYKHAATLLSRTLFQIILTLIIKKSEHHDEYKVFAKHRYLELDSLLDFFINNTKKILASDEDPNLVKVIKDCLLKYKESGRITSNLATHSELHILTDHEVMHIQAKLQIVANYFLPKLSSGQ